MFPKIQINEIIPFIISVLFHPLMMPTFGIAIILNVGAYYSLFPFDVKRNILGLVFVITVVLPLIVLPLLYVWGKYSSLLMISIQERRIPLFVAASSYYLTYFIFKDIQGLYLINIYLLAITTIIAIALIINYMWKISLHMIGLGGILALLFFLHFLFFADVYNILLCMILCTGLVASSRLYLQEHTLGQISAGFFLGSFVMSAFLLAI